MNNKIIKQLAESCGFMEFERDIFECNLQDLWEFAQMVIEVYEKESENDFGRIADKNTNERYGFTAYGKKEDWE